MDFALIRRIVAQTVIYAESAYFGLMYCRCRRWHDQASPCMSSSEFHCLPGDCLVIDTNIPIILYRIKRLLFSLQPLTSQHLEAGPEGDCNSWGRAIKISLNKYYISRERST